MCAHNYTMKKSCLSNIMSYFIVPDSIIMKQDQADKWSWKKQKLNYRENNWIYGIALNFSPGVHKNKRIIIYMAFMKYKTIGMTEILIDGGLTRINKTEGLLIYSHPLQQCHNFISFQSLLNHFLKLKLKQKITLGVKFPIHTLSWRPVKVT